MKLMILVLIIFLLAFPFLSFAQGFDDNVDDVGAPLDGGVSLLIVSAATYGVKKAIDSRRSKQNK